MKLQYPDPESPSGTPETLFAMPKPRSLYQSDLRYLLHPAPSSSPRNILGHLHWIAALIVLIGIGIWLGSRPDASTNPTLSGKDSSKKLKSQIIQVLETRKENLEQDIETASLGSFSTSDSPATTIEFAEDTLGAPDHPVNPTLLSHPRTLPPLFPEIIIDMRSVALLNKTLPDSTLATVVTPPLKPPLVEDAASSEPPSDASSKSRKNWTVIEIRPGDSLAQIFKNSGLDPAVAIRIASHPEGKILAQLHTGPRLTFQLDTDNGLLELRYEQSRRKTLRVWREQEHYRFETLTQAFEVRQREVTGSITTSLYESGQRNGLSDQMLHGLASIFSWQVDFARDIRPGDQYSVIYEERYLNNQKISTGPILAVGLVLSGKSYQAIRHVGESGQARYYSPDGTSLAGVFLRWPTRTGQITSGYSLRRYHPILKRWRPHRALDYKGRTGDPVMATADGTVVFAGNKGAYGRTVILRHGNRYRTLYAHLSKFGRKIQVGQRVKQGQIIGRIGSTGLSTGPHLHYELHIDKKPVNPLKAKLPRTAPLAKAARPGFIARAQVLSQRLDRLIGA